MSLALPPLAEPGSGESANSTAGFARSALTARTLKGWGISSAVSMLDQGLTSGTGFVVNLVLARWMTPGAYGAFAVTFAVFLFISGFHNVLLLEPLSVMGPFQYASRLPAYFRAQIMVHGLLVGVLSLAGLLGGLILWRFAPDSPLVSATFACAMVLPVLLLLWLARRMCYVMQRPEVAVAGSAAYLLLIVAGLATLRFSGKISPFSAFILMGAGSLLATWILVNRLGLQADGRAGEEGLCWRTVLGENWTYGRWLVGSTLTWSIASQTQLFLVAAFLGLGAAGILRAMQLPSLVMTQINTATALLVLPTLSYDFGKGSVQRLRQKASLINLVLGGAAGCSTLALLVLATPTERFLFGGKYAQYAWLIPVLALAPAVTALSIGYSMALRAAQKPHFDLLANAIAAPVGVASAFIFVRLWGLAGAATSMILSLAVISGVTIACFRSCKWNRE